MILFVMNQEKYTVAFLITILFLEVLIIGYFMGHFLYKPNCKVKCN